MNRLNDHDIPTRFETRRARRRRRSSARSGVWLEPVERRLLLASIVVNSTEDTTKNDGVTTLREAIASANSTSTADVITFNLGSGAKTINLGSALPTLTRPSRSTDPARRC
jgi:CSLREA domain-containing protein